MAATGVDGHDASHGGDAAHGGVGSEEPAGSREIAVQCSQHNSGLHAHAVAFVGHNAAEIARKIQHDAAAKRLAGQAGAGPAGVDWQVVFCRVAHSGHDVVERARPHHSQRPQFIDARVAGV
jgi:hypothetical protein